MATSLGLPLLPPGDSPISAWRLMADVGVCALLVEEPSSLRLLEESAVWDAIVQGKRTLSEVNDKRPVVTLTFESLSSRSPFEMAALIPSVAATKLAVFFADRATLQLYGLAPKQRYCVGPLRHSLPPSSNLGPDGKCAQCNSSF